MDKASDRRLVEYYRHQLFSNGTQYYAAARMLFIAGGAPVTGNLTHHAIEMFLKGALCRAVPLKRLANLREFGHSLTRLWGRFKTETEDATLARFDGTIAVLDPWEELRYPDKVLGLALRLSFDPAPLPPTPPGASRSYQLALRELDKLVECILVKASVSPAGLALNVNHAGRAALARENATGIWTAREP